MSSHPDAARTDCNQIFLNFVPCVVLDPCIVEDAVRRIVMQYGWLGWFEWFGCVIDRSLCLMVHLANVNFRWFR